MRQHFHHLKTPKGIVAVGAVAFIIAWCIWTFFYNSGVEQLN